MIYNLLIRRARQVVTFDGTAVRAVEQGTIACHDGVIVWLGADAGMPSELQAAADTVEMAADGLVVLPGLIDSHTHMVFAGTREDEFEEKLRGITYADIARKGGGIRRTMTATRRASLESLLASARQRVATAAALGVTTVEIKSGYGLSVEDELKILRVIRALKEESPVRLIATFLGAHTIPPEFDGRRQDYVRLVCEDMIPAVADEGLAEFCDVFCETDVFTPGETRAIFRSALDHGLKLKLHADQLTNTAGAELCADMGAVSADHLEHVSEAGIQALAGSKTVAGLLPGCSFFLNMAYAPARRLIEAGVPVALATDFNPGSSMTQNLQLIMSIACTQMRMSVDEAILGVTQHAARALARKDIGNLAPGFRADMAFFDVPNYTYIPYHYGHNHVVRVIRDGRVVFSQPNLQKS